MNRHEIVVGRLQDWGSLAARRPSMTQLPTHGWAYGSLDQSPSHPKNPRSPR